MKRTFQSVFITNHMGHASLLPGSNIVDSLLLRTYGYDKLTHYQTTNFRLVQIESLQTTISNLMKIAESSLNRKKNTVGKGKIAHYEQFLLFPLCFRKACFPGVSKGVIVWEWVNSTCG